MIIGNGLIASAFSPHFSDDTDVIVFASGVSNSREYRSEEFLRERQLLVAALRQERFLLYFSTCSVSDAKLLDTPYVVHKKEMESLVRSSKDYVIFRLPQVVGRTPNPHTLTNYFYRQIMSGANFQVWRHATRNFIDIDDVALIITHLVQNFHVNGTTTNIACPFSISIPRFITTFECALGKKANYTTVEAGGAYFIDSNLATEAASAVGIVFDENYIKKMIKKYYVK